MSEISDDQKKTLGSIIEICKTPCELTTIIQRIGDDAESYAEQLRNLGMLEERRNPETRLMATPKGLRFLRLLEEIDVLWNSP